MRNSITSTAQMIEKITAIADEKEKSFQLFIKELGADPKSEKPAQLSGKVWRMFFEFQLEMLKAAIGDVKGARDNPTAVAVCKTNFYHYPADISDANEGDIWLDLDGRPHFILGDGWIEARGFMPNCAEGQRIECETAEGKFSKSTFPIKGGQWLRSISPSSNQIAKFKLT